MHEINTYSPNRWNTLLIFSIFFSIFLLVFLAENITSSINALIIAVTIGLLLVFVSYKSFKAKVLIHITDKTFSIKWLKNYWFLPRKDLNINYLDIESWIIDSWDKYKLLKLTLHSGKTIYFTFNPSKSLNYLDFETQLSEKINTLNANPYSPKIKVGKNWYQTNLAKIVLFALFMATVYLSFDVIDNRKYHFKSIFGMILMLLNFLLFGYRMYLENWKSK